MSVRRAAARTRYTTSQAIMIGLVYPMIRVLWRAEISGHVPIAGDRGAVIVCNHISPVDPGFITLGVDRVMHWMVAKEYCQHPAVGWFFRIFEAIPTSRGGIDTAATKQMIRYAEEGKLVGLFPEGRINDSGQFLLPGRSGAAMIALKAQVSVIPCYVSGSPYEGSVFGCLIKPAKARMVVGEPIDISEYYDGDGDRETLDKLTRLFMSRIAALGGRPDFQPQLAGRFYKTAATTPRQRTAPAEQCLAEG
ncbi:MAG: 1-acyl-sn-glycerol-3-phosphate acyltransferase [Pirellulales bacterium]|nr:1-acyl-sn-glycerol-3-phosphate acyltransferase [Pirellulales bacterium]